MRSVPTKYLGPCPAAVVEVDVVAMVGHVVGDGVIGVVGDGVTGVAVDPHWGVGGHVDDDMQLTVILTLMESSQNALTCADLRI